MTKEKQVQKILTERFGEESVVALATDPNTCLLKIRLTDGVLYSNGTRYDF